MAKTSLEELSQIDDLLPRYDFRAAYQIRIDAPRPVVYECLLHSDFSELWMVRFLMTLRTGKRMLRSRAHCDIREWLQGTGFAILDEHREEELVIGVAGRFWRPDGGRCLDLTPASFTDFQRTGYAKVAWNFKLSPAGPDRTILSTETRIECFGRAARWKFRAYWSAIAPFSGLIRRAILKQVKSKAETKK